MKIDNVSWSDIQTYFLIERKFSEKSSSVYALKSRFRILEHWFRGKELNRENLNLFIQEQLEKGISKSTCNKFISMVKNLGLYFKSDEFRDYSLFKDKHAFTDEVLTPDELTRIANVYVPYKKFSEFLNNRNRVLITLLATTGCRVGEALGLRWSDVKDTPPHVIFRDTKSNEDRVVPIGQRLFEELEAIHQGNSFVFVSARNSKPLLPQEVNLDLKRRAELCGIKKRIFNHLLRHSFITEMLQSDVGLLDVMSLVGHKRSDTTLRYSHSNLNYYSDVIRCHPLLRNERTWEGLIEKFRKYAKRYVDQDRYQVEMNEASGEFVLRIKRT